MIVLAGAVGGALWGAYVAHARQGSPLDMAQYAAGFGIAFALLGVLATLLLERML
jgi:hypothetical protein